jgi:hypothetical protein
MMQFAGDNLPRRLAANENDYADCAVYTVAKPTSERESSEHRDPHRE